MKYPIPSGSSRPVYRRGRRPFSVVCPELKVKPCPDRWLTEEEAAARLGTDHNGIISMLSNRDLKPAIHQERLYIEAASVDMKLSEAGLSKPPPRPVWSDQLPVSAIPPEPDPEPEQELKQEPELDPEPDSEDILDDNRPEEKKEFIPTKLTGKITNSRRWTTDCCNPFRRKFDPYVNRDLEIELVEYAPGQSGYRIEDVAKAINKMPVVVQNFITGHKVKADPTGQYVTQESLKAFIRKSRGVEIRDI